jgi:hypothetical protein
MLGRWVKSRGVHYHENLFMDKAKGPACPCRALTSLYDLTSIWYPKWLAMLSPPLVDLTWPSGQALPTLDWALPAFDWTLPTLDWAPPLIGLSLPLIGLSPPLVDLTWPS